MATTTTTMTPYSNTDALFRQWCQHIHDTLALGWTQTADTGQINLTTVTKPAGANTKQGYEIWEMADSLQATAPCTIRIDYGSGAAATYLGVWLTLGTGSDGSGNITGKLFDGGAVAAATLSNNSQDTVSQALYGSADTNRFTFNVGGVGGVTYLVILGIERTKDSSGADTADGFLIAGKSAAATKPSGYTGTVTNAACWIHYCKATGSQPPMSAGWNYVLANESPTAFGSDVGVGLVIPMATVAQQPGTNFAVCRTGDFILSATPAMTLYGASVTYVRLAATVHTNAGAVDGTAVILMRYD